MLDSVSRRDDLRFFFRYPETTDWSDKETSYLHMEDRDRKRRLEEMYVKSLKESWIVLCPRGMGSSSIRLYETLCMGRIPVHVSDEYTYPFADEIDYSRFCITLPQGAADVAGDVLARWLRGKTEDDLAAICREARSVWEKHFRPDDAKGIMLRMLARHKAAPGPVKRNKYVPIRSEDGRGKRMGYAPGFFKNMDIDNREVWLNRPFKVEKSALDPNGVMNECNGIPCYLAPQDIRFLFAVGQTAPLNAAILEIGS
ncbi:exostosin family protein [Pseudodesulfovibrio sp.]|uniref:exostosin domain-containing protein n=1 Tax=Pseudodesulfovibrio sp. TaxID=2035812 RepID=UPI002621739F|nr:exostosin family protein [Pseudodesulfovibrio sp.]MDD3313839.1 exostosin family protein [Pseudodesulfovibrio sp.]